MLKIFTNSLASKIFAANALIIVAALAVAGLNGYFQSERAIDNAVYNHVYGVLGERKARIQAWKEELQRDLNAITALSDLSITTLNSILRAHLNSNQSFIYCAVIDESGNIITETGEDLDLDKSYKLSTLRGAFSGSFSLGTIHLGLDNRSIINAASPFQFKDSSSTSLVYLCQIQVSTGLEPILADTVGLGNSGESFLVGVDTVMLTPSRFHNHPDPLTHKMPIPAVLKALDGASGVNVYHNFLGQQVVGAYAFLTEFNWVLITEMVTEEAFAPLKIIGRNTIIVALSALLFLLVFALMISRTWAKPLERLADASLKVANEDFSIQVPEENRTDEIGTLTNQFNRMIVSLKDSREKLKQSHARLLQAQKMAAIGELASGIVHEMRNPLSVIKMNLRLLQRKDDHDLQKDPITAEQIDLATEEADRLEKMLAELLDYSKPVELNFKSIPATELAKHSRDMVQSLIDETNVKVELDVEENIEVMVYADIDLILRVLSNLLMNSIQACQADSKVKLSIRDRDVFTEIEVTDQGRGMNQAVIDRLFEPFFTTRETGIGLGMPNVKKIVEAHNGTIEVDSEVSKGTTVRISIPKEK